MLLVKFSDVQEDLSSTVTEKFSASSQMLSARQPVNAGPSGLSRLTLLIASSRSQGRLSHRRRVSTSNFNLDAPLVFVTSH
jgi:hypothetical protein